MLLELDTTSFPKGVESRVTTFKEINLVLYPDNVKVHSYANAYNVRRSVIGYNHMVISSAFLD